MSNHRLDATDKKLKSLLDQGRPGAATTLGIKTYGPDIMGYLVSILRDENMAYEVFCDFSEDLWKGLPAFRWESSFRTWAYKIAYRAAMRFLRAPHRRKERNVSPTQGHISRVQQEVRSSTRVYVKTEVKDQFAALRSRLDPDEQTLLTLRIDRKLSWAEIAAVMSEDPDPDPDILKKDAARLRQTFKRLKARIHEMAAEEGILPSD